MANSSIVNGVYAFDFSKTNLAGDVIAKQDFLLALNNLVSQFRFTVGDDREELLDVLHDDVLPTYFTDFQKSDLASSNLKSDVCYLSFDAAGRWAYHNNISWLADNDLKTLISPIENLVITIDFNELADEIFIIEQVVHVQNGEIVITNNEDNSEVLPITIDNLEKYDFYDCFDDDVLEQFGICE